MLKSQTHQSINQTPEPRRAPATGRGGSAPGHSNSSSNNSNRNNNNNNRQAWIMYGLEPPQTSN
eukprot:3324075-Lingulodinium_polyedra.AAC.1